MSRETRRFLGLRTLALEANMLDGFSKSDAGDNSLDGVRGGMCEGGGVYKLNWVVEVELQS